MQLRSLVVALVGLLVPALTAAQAVPFGKNKIQYQSFDWHVLSGEHVDVYYYPEEEELARMSLDYAEESYSYLERRFQHHPFRRIPLIVYSSHQHFEQTNVISGFIPEGVLGFTEYLKRRVALPFHGDFAQFRQTLRHELVHAFQISKLAQVSAMLSRAPRTSPQQVHWWTEGLAEYWSSEQTTEDEMFIRDLVLNGNLPTIGQFNRVRTFASYPLGAELHRYLAGRFGEEYILRIYEETWKYGSFDEALEAVLQTDLAQLTRDWHYQLEQEHFPLYADRPPLEVGADIVIGGGGANFKPVAWREPGDSVTHLVFLSPRTGYTNIYRTTLERGDDRLRTIVEGERSAEFESFHAYESGLDVGPAGVLVFVSKYLERDALFLWDLERERVVGRYQWPDLVGLKSPAWSPDGRAVVFEGLNEAGFSDLYTIDFDTEVRTRLTDDRFREADPDWSPDGSTIVFASDRTAAGARGRTNLYLMSAEGGAIRPLTRGAWNDASPTWSGDGSRIAFTSDRSGIFDLYWVDPAGDGERITRLAGGAFDPAWVPGDTAIVFSGFSEGRFRIYRYQLGTDTAAVESIALELDSAAVLALGYDASEWSWPRAENTAADTLKGRPYGAWEGLSLDFAGGEAIIVPGVAGAQAAQFVATDMLGDHIAYLGVSAVQTRDIERLADSFSGQFLYLNLTRRLNWGAGVFRFKGRFSDVTCNRYEEETYGTTFLASYPFSKFRRLEYQFGLERSDRVDLPIDFDFGLFCDTPTEETRDLTREGVIATNQISWVHDNTLWLPTGPIDGSRWNLTGGIATCFVCERAGMEEGELSNRGSLLEHFYLIGDFRRYLRVTLQSAYAVRLYGYYSDGEIPGRAALGGSHMLRGYPLYSLAGSRVGLVNQEYRFPLLQSWILEFPFGAVRLPGFQGAGFVDLGSSWMESGAFESAWGSYGAGVRTSLGGALVLRLDVGRRFALGDEPPVRFGNQERFADTFVDFFFGFNY